MYVSVRASWYVPSVAYQDATCWPRERHDPGNEEGLTQMALIELQPSIDLQSDTLRYGKTQNMQLSHVIPVSHNSMTFMLFIFFRKNNSYAPSWWRPQSVWHLEFTGLGKIRPITHELSLACWMFHGFFSRFTNVVNPISAFECIKPPSPIAKRFFLLYIILFSGNFFHVSIIYIYIHIHVHKTKNVLTRNQASREDEIVAQNILYFDGNEARQARPVLADVGKFIPPAFSSDKGIENRHLPPPEM